MYVNYVYIWLFVFFHVLNFFRSKILYVGNIFGLQTLILQVLTIAMSPF